MTSEVMTHCADLILADVLQDAACEGLSLAEARRAVFESPAYVSLYDFDTGLWQEGPDYFVDYLNRIADKQKGRPIHS